MNVLIIGATFGIGYELSKKYLDHCDNLILLGRTKEKLQNLKLEFNSRRTKVSTFSLDVTEHDNCKRIISEIVQEYKTIDLAVYCSGYYEPHETFDIRLDLFEKTFAVNFFGMINCFSILLPHFKSKQSGHLAAISSVAGFGGLPNSSSYGPSKAAMINYFESIKIDCDKNNITLSIINPGFVRSRLTEKNTFDMPFIMEADKAAEIIFEGLLAEKYEITFPIQMKIIFKFLQILPRPIYFFLVRILTKNI
jgi:short-subunit dehydrogenase